jgi:hypothetical protein
MNLKKRKINLIKKIDGFFSMAFQVVIRPTPTTSLKERKSRKKKDEKKK